MVKSISVTNPKNETLKMELTRPDLSGIVVANAEGLNPSKANVNSTQFATTDGSLVTGVKIPSRNIVLSLILQKTDTESIEDIRLKLYRYFPIKKQVRISIETDNRKSYCYGYVESNEVIIFSKEEYTQISIVCPDPNLYEDTDVQISFSGVMPEFEFPFENPSVSESLISFGYINLETRTVLNYTGDMDIGFLITIHARGTCDDIIIFNVDTYESLRVDLSKIYDRTGYRFDSGDDVVISTVPGNKYCYLLRDGIKTMMTSIVDIDSDWLKLTPGDNIFAFTSLTGERNVIVSFDYRNAYGGV